MTTNAQPVTPYDGTIKRLGVEGSGSTVALTIFLHQQQGYLRALADLAPRLEAADRLAKLLTEGQHSTDLSPVRRNLIAAALALYEQARGGR